MSNIEKLLKIEKLYKLIRSKYQGNSDDYATKLNVSRGCFFNYLDDLKIAGADIEYNRSERCFICKNDFEIKITIRTSKIDEQDMRKISGGVGKYLTPSIFLDGTPLILQLENKIGQFDFSGFPNT